MAYHTITTKEILQKTKEALHMFFERNIDSFLQLLDEDCVWIGSYEAQYAKGKQKFLQLTKKESKEQPVHLSEEEYTLLFAERNHWTVYGRYTITAKQTDGTLLIIKGRMTFVWERKQGHLRIIHIHCSDALDVPLQHVQGKPQPTIPQPENSGWFDYIRQIDLAAQNSRIQLRDSLGSIHWLFPAEIIYVQASNKKSIVHTGTDTFYTRMTLRELSQKDDNFALIHRSYMINRSYLKEFKRYQATLMDGNILPIGKERYMALKQSLNNKEN